MATGDWSQSHWGSGKDSVILGFWLQETDHKAIEDQVRIMLYWGLGSGNWSQSNWGSGKDNAILGSCLQETDHKAIEDQVRIV